MPLTRTQLARLDAKLPQDRSEIVFRFPDGWSVRHLTTRGDEHREGVLLRHCWHHQFALDSGKAGSSVTEQAAYFAAPLVDGDPFEDGDRTCCYSLRDSDNLPCVSFFLDKERLWHAGDWKQSGRLLLHEALGRASAEPRRSEIERLAAWVQTLPQPVVFSARSFDGERQQGNVLLVAARIYDDRLRAARELQSMDSIEPQVIDELLARWVSEAAPGEIRVAGPLLAGC
jgi:hypothetical protein